MMHQQRSLSRLTYFVAVVETHSFTKAAERLGVTKAVASQQVAQLEAELRTGLFVRTTRRVEPTDAGRALYERAAAILRQTEEAFAEVAHASSEPQGTLCIAAPNDYGTSMIVPTVTEFLRLYPNCRADLRFSDRVVDLLGGELDVSIRLGWLADSSLKARRLGSFDQVLVASPIFKRNLKRIASPVDLAGLPFVANTALPEPEIWKFSERKDRTVTFHARPALSIDTTQAVHAAILQGAGISVLPHFIVANDLAAGRLIQLLPIWTLPSGGIHAVFPSARFRPPRVAKFVDLLTARLSAPRCRYGSC